MHLNLIPITSSGISEGVQEANIKYDGSLRVQEIEIVPNDYPKDGQARIAAFKIAEHLLDKNR